jgi:hypothetical protein
MVALVGCWFNVAPILGTSAKAGGTVVVLETTPTPHRVSGWFLGFVTMVTHSNGTYPTPQALAPENFFLLQVNFYTPTKISLSLL